MPASNQFFAELGVVVNLTVKDDPDRPILIGERLMAALDVDDAEAAHSQAGAIGYQGSSIVGSTMQDPVVHFEQGGVVGTLTGPIVKDATDAAHIRSSSSRV